jgi:hypothetical protein
MHATLRTKPVLQDDEDVEEVDELVAPIAGAVPPGVAGMAPMAGGLDLAAIAESAAAEEEEEASVVSDAEASSHPAATPRLPAPASVPVLTLASPLASAMGPAVALDASPTAAATTRDRNLARRAELFSGGTPGRPVDELAPLPPEVSALVTGRRHSAEPTADPHQRRKALPRLLLQAAAAAGSAASPAEADVPPAAAQPAPASGGAALLMSPSSAAGRARMLQARFPLAALKGGGAAGRSVRQMAISARGPASEPAAAEVPRAEASGVGSSGRLAHPTAAAAKVSAGAVTSVAVASDAEVMAAATQLASHNRTKSEAAELRVAKRQGPFTVALAVNVLNVIGIDTVAQVGAGRVVVVVGGGGGAGGGGEGGWHADLAASPPASCCHPWGLCLPRR